MPSPVLSSISSDLPQLTVEAELGAARPVPTVPAQPPPPSATTAQRAAERARGFARGPGLVVLITGLVFIASVVVIALLIAHDVAAQDYVAAPPPGGLGGTPPAGADPVYFVWIAVANALTGALALLVSWVQAGGKVKDAKISTLEQQLEAKDNALDAMRERAYTAEATIRALGAVRSGDLPNLPPPGASSSAP